MQRKLTKTENCIWIVLVLLSVVAAIAKIFIGFDIDEGYAISMPQRLLNGDHLFLDMWEVHQTSSFLPAVFLWVFETITHGTTGVAIYLRVVATVIHLIMSILVCRACKSVDVRWRVLLMLLYCNLLPKWIISLDFSMQQIWGMTLVTIFLHQMLQRRKKYLAFLCGFSLAMTVLAYPGMVLVYPVVLLVGCILDKEIKSRINNCVYITLGCLIPAVLFFAYLLMHMSVSQLLESIPLVFMDGTHQFTMGVKLMAYGRQWMNVCKQLVIFAVPSIIITIVIKRWFLPGMLFDETTRKKTSLDKTSDGETTGCVFLFSWMAVTSLFIVFANLLGIQMGPFHFQVRYLGFFVGTFVMGYQSRKKYPYLFWEVFVLTVTSFAGILIFSNVGPDASSSYLLLGVMGGYYLLHELVKHHPKMDFWLWIGCSVFVLSLIFCKGYYVRITEYGPSTVCMQREQMTEGPLKGLYLLPEDYQRSTKDHETIVRLTEHGETLLFLGTEGINNLSARAGFVSVSTISTPAFNEQWTLYFTKYPQKAPDVVVIAKNTVDNREKFFEKNPFGIWIWENYDTMHMEETDSLCIVRKK